MSRDRREDTGAYYPGGTVIPVAPQQRSTQVPVTDVGDLPERYSLADVKAKVNQVVQVLAQRTSAIVLTLASLSAALTASADIATQTARLDALYNDSLVVTNVSGAATDPSVVSNIVESYGYATTGKVDKVAEDVEIIQDFMDGSNVVFSITNYQSGTYHLDAAKLRILELTNGVYREVYNSRDEIALHEAYFETNTLQAATNAVASGAAAYTDAKTDALAAWGNRSSSGTVLADMGITNQIHITAPQSFYLGDTEFVAVKVASGVIGVLGQNDNAAVASVETGAFYFQDAASTNYFGMKTRDNFVIGCDTDAIFVTNRLSVNHVILRYDVSGSTYPIVLYRPTLENFASNSWEQLNTSDGEPIEGASYVVTFRDGVECYYADIYIPTNQPSGFFMAQTAVTGEAEFSTNMKADLKGGIVTTDGAHIIKPVYSDGDLTWRTFDYGSGLQVSTPSQSQVTSTAKSVSTRAVARALSTDEGTVPNVYDFQNGTNFTLQIYTALTNIITTLGGTVTNAPTFNTED